MPIDMMKPFLNIIEKADRSGYDALAAIDGPAALAMLLETKRRPDLVLADYNLPNGMNGVEVSQRLRRELDLKIPRIVLI